ncbi:hypothetical protein VNO77_08029 [Canavalia gladiata]|uniref:Uncharacterized protein n=1 Tax=Canavalia gladiata TaxID=3824 RepID=A0AAN9QTM5_CANGL
MEPRKVVGGWLLQRRIGENRELKIERKNSATFSESLKANRRENNSGNPIFIDRWRREKNRTLPRTFKGETCAGLLTGMDNSSPLFREFDSVKQSLPLCPKRKACDILNIDDRVRENAETNLPTTLIQLYNTSCSLAQGVLHTQKNDKGIDNRSLLALKVTLMCASDQQYRSPLVHSQHSFP